MRIVQIAPCYVDIYKETGGVANVIREICLSLESNKINTILICTNSELRNIITTPKTIQYSKYLTVYILAMWTNPLVSPLRTLHKLLQSINEIDLVHIHTCFSAITEYSMRYYLRKSKPIIFTPHGKLSPGMLNKKKIIKNFYFNFISRPSLNKVTEFVCSSMNEIKYANELGINGKKSFIYNGYRISTEFGDQDQLTLPSKPYILFLGYLDFRKQPDLLIRAFSKTKAQKTYKLIIAGPDSYNYRENLEHCITDNKLELNSNVIFTGRVTGMNKWDLLINAKALVLPSKAEGWPVVIAEAIGAQIPSIISRECNFSEIEELKLGIEVQDFSEKSWAEAIDKICFNDELNHDINSSLVKHKIQFSWDSITQQWINKYKKIIYNSIS